MPSISCCSGSGSGSGLGLRFLVGGYCFPSLPVTFEVLIFNTCFMSVTTGTLTPHISAILWLLSPGHSFNAISTHLRLSAIDRFSPCAAFAGINLVFHKFNRRFTWNIVPRREYIEINFSQ